MLFSKTAMPPPDEKTRSLRRMKALALLALLFSLALLLLSHYMGRQGVWGWLGAFAEAATVGALADWFAVTALFRHPLGLPISHTAIIPRNQARIAKSLASFVQDKFLDKDLLMQRINAYNPAQKLGSSLSNPGLLRKFSTQMQDWAVHSLESIDSPTIERELYKILQQQLKNLDTVPIVEQLTDLLKNNHNQQGLLDSILKKIATWAGTPEVREKITSKMVETARHRYPKMLWITDKLEYTDNIAETLVTHLSQSLFDEVQKILIDPNHPLREHYSSEIKLVMQQIMSDPIMRVKIKQQKEEMLEHPALQLFVQTLWRILRNWLSNDLKKPDSHLASRFMQYASLLGSRLRHEPGWQQSINAQIQTLAWYMIDHLRQIAPEHIRKTMQDWDSEYLVYEIERNVGRDLQFIRINGTIIGGIVGVILYALVQWFGSI